MAVIVPTPEVLAAEAELVRREPALAAIVAKTGPCPIGTGRRRGSHFEALARSIAFQQLAGKAALAIWTRTRALVDGPFTPPAVLSVGEERLRTAGLSGAKAKAILDLADRVVMGDVKLATMTRRGEDEVVAELSRVWGIGRWTAEMFLMFQLGRLDVWPTGDLGVRNGYGRIFGLGGPPSPLELEDLGERFRPYRSIVAWYCWQAVDVLTPD
ncbi:MAG: DNA-3-methyladenine glycosylase [Acidimicrobiales bacterium]|nr:DNA-3-methyladenine glycosylase [Acidimicrobiales bacterium]